jgi:hypothetical protein
LSHFVYKNYLNKKDFVSHIISNEGKSMINGSSDDFNMGKESKDILTEPQIFIRKWIGEVKIIFSNKKPKFKSTKFQI